MITVRSPPRVDALDLAPSSAGDVELQVRVPSDATTSLKSCTSPASTSASPSSMLRKSSWRSSSSRPSSCMRTTSSSSLTGTTTSSVPFGKSVGSSSLMRPFSTRNLSACMGCMIPRFGLLRRSEGWWGQRRLMPRLGRGQPRPSRTESGGGRARCRQEPCSSVPHGEVTASPLEHVVAGAGAARLPNSSLQSSAPQRPLEHLAAPGPAHVAPWITTGRQVDSDRVPLKLGGSCFACETTMYSGHP